MSAPPPVVLITGASAGIGEALLQCFAKDGYHCLITGRDPHRLRAVAQQCRQQYQVSVDEFIVELSDKQALCALIAQIQQQYPRLDVLVNNAGNGIAGAFVETDADKQENSLLTNVNALTQLCQAFLPAMVQAGQGKILNIASTAAFLPGPNMAVYYATKAYVLSLSEALHEEVKNSGVTVSVLCPGMTQTLFQQRAKMLSLKLMKYNRSMMSAAKVAEIGYRGLLRHQRMIVAGGSNRIGCYLMRLLPNRLLLPIVRYLQQP